MEEKRLYIVYSEDKQIVKSFRDMVKAAEYRQYLKEVEGIDVNIVMAKI